MRFLNIFILCFFQELAVFYSHRVVDFIFDREVFCCTIVRDEKYWHLSFTILNWWQQIHESARQVAASVDSWLGGWPIALQGYELDLPLGGEAPNPLIARRFISSNSMGMDDDHRMDVENALLGPYQEKSKTFSSLKNKPFWVCALYYSSLIFNPIFCVPCVHYGILYWAISEGIGT